VIGSNIGGIPELINENNGFLFDSGDNRSLLTVINRAIMISDVSYRELSINCLRWAKEYLSRDNHYKKLMDIYNLTIKNNNN
jgi:glycosyltransferase involved in cell wall biosynthesis